MSYAVLEKQLRDLSIADLAQAFERLPGLTKQDAGVRAKDAAGVLATHLSRADAGLLSKALAERFIATLIVDQDSLPQLPKARAVRRAIPREEDLVIYDPLGREQQIPWSSVTLLAAGNVHEEDFKHAHAARDPAHAARSRVALSDLEAKQSIRLNLMLEILLSCEPRRCCIEGNIFSYEFLGDRRSNRTADNFVTFVRLVMQRARGAVRNRGAELFRTIPPQALTYPSRHAFEREIVWQLWARRAPVPVA